MRGCFTETLLADSEQGREIVHLRISRIEFPASFQKFSCIRSFLKLEHRSDKITQRECPDDVGMFATGFPKTEQRLYASAGFRLFRRNGFQELCPRFRLLTGILDARDRRYPIVLDANLKTPAVNRCWLDEDSRLNRHEWNFLYAWRVHDDKRSAIGRVKRLEEISRAPFEKSIAGIPEQASVRLRSQPFRKVANDAALVPNHSANLSRNGPYVCCVGNDGMILGLRSEHCVCPVPLRESVE